MRGGGGGGRGRGKKGGGWENGSEKRRCKRETGRGGMKRTLSAKGADRTCKGEVKGYTEKHRWTDRLGGKVMVMEKVERGEL